MRIWLPAFSRKMALIMLRSDPTTSAKATSVKRISVAGYRLFSTGFLVAGDVGTFEWDFVTTDSNGQKVRTAGCDLLRFVGDKVATKNAFRKVRG
jgi:hypothetical protein